MNVNDKPKITVGTVCYNAVSFIENLIKSVSTNSLSDISKARNNFAHGSMRTMSFNDIQSKFYKSILIFQELDKVMK